VDRGSGIDPVAARDLYAELLPISQRMYGPEHPDTLTARAALAKWTGHAGDPVAAATSTPSCCRSSSCGGEQLVVVERGQRQPNVVGQRGRVEAGAKRTVGQQIGVQPVPAGLAHQGRPVLFGHTPSTQVPGDGGIAGRRRCVEGSSGAGVDRAPVPVRSPWTVR